jgi:alkylation response protein AidB-like acyl-CoA dehydrogenase
MDFRFGEEQTMVRELARGILAKEVTPERVKAIEEGEDWHDARLWQTLGQAGLLGIAIPEQFGGMGLGLLELCVLLEELGRSVAPVPAIPALVLAGATIAELGLEDQRQQLLAPLAKGDAIFTAALDDAAPSEGPLPATVAKRDGRAWILDGEKRLVPAAHLARRILVPARTDGSTALFLVDPEAEGVSLTQRRTSRGEPLFDLRLARVRVEGADLLGDHVDPDDRLLEWIRRRAIVATCAVQVGVSERALEMTADYVRERVQFGVPIGSFQAVQHRLADGFIDLSAMRWVTWRAAWKLARGEDARREVAVAKFWAAEAGARIAATAQHLHAGIGVDVDYPIHRYFLWSKALEVSFGGAHAQLAGLGRDLARNAPAREAGT